MNWKQTPSYTHTDVHVVRSFENANRWASVMVQREAIIARNFSSDKHFCLHQHFLIILCIFSFIFSATISPHNEQNELHRRRQM